MAETRDVMGPSTSLQDQNQMEVDGEEIVVKVEIASPPPSPGDPCTDLLDSMVCDPAAVFPGQGPAPTVNCILGNVTDTQNPSPLAKTVKVEEDLSASRKKEGARAQALIFAKRNVLTDRGFERMMALLSNSSGKVSASGDEPSFRSRYNYGKILGEKMKPEIIKESMKPRFKCHRCSKVFTLDRYLRSHSAICDPSVLECDVCGESMTDRETLEKHKAEATCGTCKECGKTFTEATAFKAHRLLAHAEGATFKCSICKFSFKRVFSLTNHIRKVHSKKSLECKSCGKFLPDLESLAEHQSDNTCAKCVKCGKIFSDLSAFRAHMLHEHTTKEPSVCTICNKEFNSMSILNQHNRKYHPPKTYVCSTCGMLLSDQESLNVHEAEQSCVKCYDCGKVFESNCALKKHHLLMHPVDKAHKCNLCTRSFDKENALIWHLRNIHKDPNPFVCKICGHRSPFRAKHKSHLKTHKKKRFACTMCDMRFVTAFVLKTHMLRIHEQNKPFACNQCPKKFAVENFLTEHVNHVHNPDRALKWQVRLESITNTDSNVEAE